MKWEILNLFRNNKKHSAVNTNHTYKQVIFFNRQRKGMAL